MASSIRCYRTRHGVIPSRMSLAPECLTRYNRMARANLDSYPGDTGSTTVGVWRPDCQFHRTWRCPSGNFHLNTDLPIGLQLAGALPSQAISSLLPVTEFLSAKPFSIRPYNIRMSLVTFTWICRRMIHRSAMPSHVHRLRNRNQET